MRTPERPRRQGARVGDLVTAQGRVVPGESEDRAGEGTQGGDQQAGHDREVDPLPHRRADTARATGAPRYWATKVVRYSPVPVKSAITDHTAKRPVTAPAMASAEYQVRKSRSTNVWIVNDRWLRMSGYALQEGHLAASAFATPQDPQRSPIDTQPAVETLRLTRSPAPGGRVLASDRCRSVADSAPSRPSPCCRRPRHRPGAAPPPPPAGTRASSWRCGVTDSGGGRCRPDPGGLSPRVDGRASPSSPRSGSPVCERAPRAAAGRCAGPPISTGRLLVLPLSGRTSRAAASGVSCAPSARPRSSSPALPTRPRGRADLQLPPAPTPRLHAGHGRRAPRPRRVGAPPVAGGDRAVATPLARRAPRRRHGPRTPPPPSRPSSRSAARSSPSPAPRPSSSSAAGSGG